MRSVLGCLALGWPMWDCVLGLRLCVQTTGSRAGEDGREGWQDTTQSRSGSQHWATRSQTRSFCKLWGRVTVATSHNSLGLKNGHWKAQAGLHSDFVFSQTIFLPPQGNSPRTRVTCNRSGDGRPKWPVRESGVGHRAVV